VGRIDPRDGDLGDVEFMDFGDVELFGVECEAFYCLSWENDVACVFSESFEAALGVGESGEGEDAEEYVVDAAHVFAVPGLVHLYVGSLHGSGTDDDVGAGLEHGPESFDLVDGG